MGSFANTLFKFMLGWLQGIVSAVWSAFTNENGDSFFVWVGRNWILIAGVLCLTGLVCDLAVYIIRWKPFKAWKRLFRHSEDAEEETGTTEDHVPVRPEERPLPDRRGAACTDPVRKEQRPHRAEPDLSQWETEKEDDEPDCSSDAGPVFVTNAGYYVPANSPYRRPADYSADDEEQDTEAFPDPKGSAENPSPVAPRKRRRISVSELLSDPEEELHEIDAPQHVIDRRKAYHEPVYPRGWKKNEGDGE